MNHNTSFTISVEDSDSDDGNINLDSPACVTASSVTPVHITSSVSKYKTLCRLDDTGCTMCTCNCCASMQLSPLLQSTPRTPAYCKCNQPGTKKKCWRCYKSSPKKPMQARPAPFASSMMYKFDARPSTTTVASGPIVQSKPKRKHSAISDVRKKAMLSTFSKQIQGETYNSHTDSDYSDSSGAEFSDNNPTKKPRHKQQVTLDGTAAKVKFFAELSKNFTKVCDTLWILPNLVETSYIASTVPCYTLYWGFAWHCSCPQQRHISLPLGKCCWHIQWVIKQFVLEMQQDNRDVVVTVATQDVPVDNVNSDANVTVESEKGDSTSRQYQKIVQQAMAAKGTGKRLTRSVVAPAILQAGTKNKTNAIVAAQDTLWEVSQIVGRRVHNNNHGKPQLQYLIAWKGYASKYNSWEYIDDLFCDELIAAYEQNRTNTAEQEMFAAGNNPYTNDVVQYNTSNYFLVPYGNGQFNKFCVVGPDRTNTVFKCRYVRHPSALHHLNHGRSVLNSIHNEDGKYRHLNLLDLLPNYGKNPHFMLADAADAESNEQTYLENIKACSTHAINLDLCDATLEKMSDLEYLAKLVKREVFSAEPPTTNGNCENPILLDTGEQASSKCAYKQVDVASKLYTEFGVYNVIARSWHCTQKNSNCAIHYDGHNEGVFHYTAGIMVTYPLLLDFVFTMLSGNGITFTGYVKKMNLKYSLATACKQPFMHVSTWISCFFSWAMLVHKGTTFRYSCTICGTYPSWIGFDGVSLACPKRHIQWSTVDQIPNVSDPVKEPSSTCSKKATRLLIADKTVRAQLASFLVDQCTAVGFTQLLAALVGIADGVRQLLEHLYTEELIASGRRNRVSNYSFYGIWKELLGVCASADAVNFFLHPAVVVALMDALTINTYPATIAAVFNTRCPVLSKLFLMFPEGKVPVYARQLFLDLVAKSKVGFPDLYGNVPSGSVQLINRPTPIAITQPSVDSTLVPTYNLQHDSSIINVCQISEEETAYIKAKYPVITELPSTLSGTFWSWPKIRQHCVYTGLDSVSKPKEWADADDDTLTDNVCKKADSRKYVNKDNIAGMFVGCCIHTITYGASLMLAPEGRKDVFKILYERMPAEALDQLSVVYDAACQAAEYCVKREPELFALTHFYVDRFHGMTHTCNNFWKLTAYPNLIELITSSSESLNDFLQQFHSAAAFMKQETLMRFFQFITGVRNWLITKNLIVRKNMFNSE